MLLCIFLDLYVLMVPRGDESIWCDPILDPRNKYPTSRCDERLFWALFHDSLTLEVLCQKTFLFRKHITLSYHLLKECTSVSLAFNIKCTHVSIYMLNLNSKTWICLEGCCQSQLQNYFCHFLFFSFFLFFFFSFYNGKDIPQTK